jgi:tight adherence protein C
MALLLGLVAVTAFGLALRGYKLLTTTGLSLPFLDGDGDAVVTRRGPRRTIFGRLLEWLDKIIGRRVLGSVTAPILARADRALAQAGYPGGFTAERLIARQASWAALGGALGLILLFGGNVLGLLIPLPAALVPRYLVWSAGRRRQQAIERYLPDFLDVLTVTISAGIGFRSALARVAAAVGGPVGDEMLLAIRQIDLGATRRSAFEQLRARNSSKAMGHFVTAFLQSEELGSPLSGFLSTYAEEMRVAAGQRAKTAAARANPKISMVITLVIIPAITLFMVGSIVLTAVLK